MTDKQPTIESLKADLAKANKKVQDLEKRLASEVSFASQLSEKLITARHEINQVHALLDVLPGAGPRKTDIPELVKQSDLEIVTRLAAYLANRGAI